MKLEDLYLEVTRRCNLNCEHCLRGEQESKSMSITTLENALKDVHSIKLLLLSGGEPLLNRKVLEALPGIIQKNNIQVDRIGIITNGTVFSTRHVEALQEIQKVCNQFQIFISNDPFHQMEWKKRGMDKMVERNYQEYSKYFDIKKYPEQTGDISISIKPIGKAETLSEKVIRNILNNTRVKVHFEKQPPHNNIILHNDSVEGKLCIDVNGFLVGFSKSYKEEEDDANTSFNVNFKSLWEIIPNYIEETQRNKQKKYFYYQ